MVIIDWAPRPSTTAPTPLPHHPSSIASRTSTRSLVNCPHWINSTTWHPIIIIIIIIMWWHHLRRHHLSIRILHLHHHRRMLLSYFAHRHHHETTKRFRILRHDNCKNWNDSWVMSNAKPHWCNCSHHHHHHHKINRTKNCYSKNGSIPCCWNRDCCWWNKRGHSAGSMPTTGHFWTLRERSTCFQSFGHRESRSSIHISFRSRTLSSNRRWSSCHWTVKMMIVMMTLY